MPQRLTIRQALFFERDARHRGLVLIERNAVTGADLGPEYTALVFGPDREVQELDLVNVPGLVERWDFLWQGAWHILIGYDHILFLLTLLLTSVLVPVGAGWAAEKRFSRAFLNVAGIVTVFTVAHSSVVRPCSSRDRQTAESTSRDGHCIVDNRDGGA